MSTRDAGLRGYDEYLSDHSKRRGRTRAGYGVRYEAFDEIRPGDVIRWGGRLRTVRGVTRYDDDAIHSVAFAKVKRSGYPSPGTSYGRHELRRRFGGIVARRKGPLCAVELECRLQRELETGHGGNRSLVTESETVGVIW